MNSRAGKIKTFAAAFAAALVLAAPSVSSADEYKLPDAAEISTFSSEALSFYSSGVASLDRADDLNAYSQLVKAAQLQPNAMRLNHLAAAMATRRGRATAGAESRNHYETAVALYETILKARDLDENFRRDVTNRLKVIKDERDNIDQRDTKFDAIGTLFIQDLNKQFVAKAKEREAKKAAAARTPAPAVGVQQPGGAYPLQPAGVGVGYGVAQNPGVGVPQLPNAIQTPGPAGGDPTGGVLPAGGGGYFQPGTMGQPGQQQRPSEAI